jgi:two-component system chemotaxis sensor kinase CheA
VIDELAELLDVFRDEADGRLDSLVDAVLALESGRSGGDLIEGLLRDIHTIKGGAAVVGLDDVAALAHAIEDLLEPVSETGVFPPELAEPLLRAADSMRAGLRGEAVTAAPVAPVTPVTETRSIRVAAEKLDRLLDLVGESLLHQRRLEHVLGSEAAADELDVGERLLGELKDTAVGLRMLPLSAIATALPRAVRDIAASEGKAAELTVHGLETELDRAVLEGLTEPLVHLLRNAVAHGIESPEERSRKRKPSVGTVELRAAQRGNAVEVTVSDDGAGVSEAVREEARKVGSLADVLCRSGFSTADSVSNLAGRGVGLDAVRRFVEGLGGSFEVRSEPGQGTEFILLLPLALALLEVLLVESDGNVYGIPLASVSEAVDVHEPVSLGGRPHLRLRGEALPLAGLAQLLGAPGTSAPASVGIVVAAAGRSAAVTCDTLLGQEEVVVKPLGPLLAAVEGYLGAAVLGDGRVALLVDPAALLRGAVSGPARRTDASAPARQSPKVLVVEDSVTVRELQRSILETAGYRTVTARHGREGLERLLADTEIELVVTDVEMPELDGLELTRLIRAHPERGNTPVVIVTSCADDAARERGLVAGADAYMVKQGFEQEALLETVQRLVGR